MKRSFVADEDTATGDLKKMKMKMIEGEEDWKRIDSVLLDENLLFEVLKHADARTLGAAACVSKQWNRASLDERLWEMICTRDYGANTGCSGEQLRSVVLALGGFRRLHSNYLSRLSKQQSSSSSSSSWPCLPPPPIPTKAKSTKTRWGKDEVQLSLCLLSIRCFEKMNVNNRGK